MQQNSSEHVVASVEYTWTEDDVKRAQKQMLKPNSLSGKATSTATGKVVRIHIFAVIGSLFVVALVASSGNPNTNQSWIAILVGAISFAIFFTIAIAVSKRILKKPTTESGLHPEMEKMPTQCRAWIGDEGITFEGRLDRTLCKWGGFVGLESTEEFIIVVQSAIYSRFIPVRAFASVSESAAFYGELVKRHEAAKRALGAENR